eukprot:gene11332-23716_t
MEYQRTALSLDELYDKFERENNISGLRNKPILFDILLQKYKKQLEEDEIRRNAEYENNQKHIRPSRTVAQDPRDRYIIEERIGRGGFGYVYRATDTVLGKTVAAKIINLEHASDEMDDAQQEIAIMSDCNCPQLTKYFASYVVGSYLWIIMEYLECGSLADIIKDFSPLDEDTIAYVMKELLQ